MDCTDWSVHSTEARAADYLLAIYYDRPDDEMTEDEREERLELEYLGSD